MMRRTALSLSAVALVLLTSSCASYRSYRLAQTAASAEEWDEAVLHYMEAASRNPENIAYKAALLRAKIQASREHFAKARRFHETGVLERALVEYQQAVQLDPSNQSAAVELEKVRQQLVASREKRKGDETIDDLKKRVAKANQPPVLNPRSNEPIDLDFPEPVSIMNVYRALGRAFGINIMFDPNLKDQEVAVELKQVKAQDALEFLMRTAGHFYKVLDETSIIIIADTPQNRRNYEDLVIKTFFLSNAEVKDVVTMLRSLIDARKIATNDQLNAIILRDTADKVKVAERIIEANDKSRAEVVIDVELLQINTTKLRDLGVRWPDSISTAITTGTSGEGTSATSNPLRVSDLEFLNQSNWTISAGGGLPSWVVNFVKSNTDAQLLAKPQLRISEGEKASLTIGDRVPIPVTSFNTANTVGSNIVPVTSFQYQDVGIKIAIEPRVHHNREVTLKVSIEVSQQSGEVRTSTGSQPIIGTRAFESKIRLKDGETNFLAGLIRTDDKNSESGVPGLSEIPILGRLFSSNNNDNQRTDVILTLTPHIIRAADITEEDLAPIWVGTEQNITFRGGSPRVESEVEGPFDEGLTGQSEEEVKELIQRRIQQLPRELRDQVEGQEEPPPQLPQGTELVPGTSGGGPFVPPPQVPPQEEQVEPPIFGVPEGEEPPPNFGGGNASAAFPLGASLPAVRFASNEASPVRLRLVPARVSVALGDEFEVSLEVESQRNLAHLPLTLSFDPELLSVLEVRRGGFLGASKDVQVLSSTSRPGELVIGASHFGETPGASGRGTVLVLRLKARGMGSSQLGFAKAYALSPTLEAVSPVAAESMTVQVNRIAPADRPDLPGRRSIDG
jgi:general secretion pathway protein D